MKICFFTDTFFPLVGGAETVLHNLALQVSGRAAIHVLAPRVRGVDNRVDAPYRVHRYAKPSSKRFFVRQVLWHLLRIHVKYGIDVLHCHSAYPPAYVAATFRRWTGVPYVVRPHGSDVVPDGRIRSHSRLEKRLRAAFHSADAVIAQGLYLKEIMLELGVDEKKIHVIHNGVDLDHFSRAGARPLPNPYILALGNLIPRKGFDILLRAYARVEEPRPELVIAGPGPEEGRLKALAVELGIEGRTRFTGFMEGREKADLLRSAEFFVCPSHKEPFANVILEAMAAGLPVIASDVDGNRELVHHGDHGLLFPPGDVEGLSAAMEDMIRDRALADRLRRAVPGFVAGFGWPRVARRYVDLYDAVCAKRTR